MTLPYATKSKAHMAIYFSKHNIPLIIKTTKIQVHKILCKLIDNIKVIFLNLIIITKMCLVEISVEQVKCVAEVNE